MATVLSSADQNFQLARRSFSSLGRSVLIAFVLAGRCVSRWAELAEKDQLILGRLIWGGRTMGEGRYQAYLWRLDQPKPLFISVSKDSAVTKGKDAPVSTALCLLLLPVHAFYLLKFVPLHFHLPPWWQSFSSSATQHLSDGRYLPH